MSIARSDRVDDDQTAKPSRMDSLVVVTAQVFVYAISLLTSFYTLMPLVPPTTSVLTPNPEETRQDRWATYPDFSQTSPKTLTNFLVCTDPDFTTHHYYLTICKHRVFLYSLLYASSHSDVWTSLWSSLLHNMDL